MKRRIKINGFIMLCAFLLVIFFPAVFFRNGKPGSFNIFAKMFGVAFILFGQLLRVCARGFKSENSAGGSSLIQGGPYSLVRNPMYLGILFIGIGIVTTLFKWWAVAIFLFVFVGRYILLIFREEKKLKQAFSKDYRYYMHQVPRLLPSLGKISKTDVAEYLPLKSAWLNKEIGSISAVLFIVLLFDFWQGSRSKGIGAYLDEALFILIIIISFICLLGYLISRTKIR